MKVYYAHSKALYGTAQEKRDVATLKTLGFSVVNPNTKARQKASKNYSSVSPGRGPMDYFMDIAQDCDVLAFRALPDGRIPCGVAEEIENFAGPVIELPSSVKYRFMSLEHTLEYLQEIGQR